MELESAIIEPADFYVIGFEGPLAESSRNSTIRKVENGGVFRFMKAYSRRAHRFWKNFDLFNFPPDMTYPFPTILLFRKWPIPTRVSGNPTAASWVAPPLAFFLAAAMFAPKLHTERP